jgi:phage-related protein
LSRTFSTGFRDEKNKLESAQVIRLFKIYTSTPLYLAEYDTDITFDSNTYTAVPMASSSTSENISGKIDSLSVTIGNANRDMVAIIQAEDLMDVQVDMIEVFANNLGDPNACIRDTYYISNISVKAEAAIFTLDSLLMRVDIILPRRTFSKGTCQWVFKSSQCGFMVNYANVNFTANSPSANYISWAPTTIGVTSINAGNAQYTGERLIIYYIEGNSVLVGETNVNEFLKSKSPKWVALAAYNGGTQITRYWSKTVSGSGNTDSCDYIRDGSNGCGAHNNSTRFGGFPGIGNYGRYYL